MKNINENDRVKQNTFSFGELITNLRPHYLQIRKDLNSLQEHIKIKSPIKYTAEIDFAMMNDSYQTPNDTRVFLRVYGKPRKDLPTMATFALNQNGDINAEFLRDDLSSMRTLIDSSTYKPRVSIEDTDEVRELDEKIKTNPIFNLPTLKSTELNRFQRLYISSSGIYLTENEDNCNENISLRYDPDLDKVILVSTKPRTRNEINSVLGTRVPKYILHPSYYELIKKVEAGATISIEDDFKMRRAKFAFEPNGKRLVLVPKK